jgi:hypothetical protein
MEQGHANPRAVLGAIVAGSATAVSFLLWLLYVHQASAQFAGRWTFLPALNAFLNGLSAIALCGGGCTSSSIGISEPRGAMDPVMIRTSEDGINRRLDGFERESGCVR